MKYVNSEEICYAIKKRRTELKISQRMMAEVTGLSKYAIILLESNRKSPTLKTLEKVCEVLRLDLYIAEKQAHN